MAPGTWSVLAERRLRKPRTISRTPYAVSPMIWISETEISIQAERGRYLGTLCLANVLVPAVLDAGSTMLAFPVLGRSRVSLGFTNGSIEREIIVFILREHEGGSLWMGTVCCSRIARPSKGWNAWDAGCDFAGRFTCREHSRCPLPLDDLRHLLAEHHRSSYLLDFLRPNFRSI